MADEMTGTGPQNVRPDVWDLLPGYALDALDDLDRRAVERLLESDADARRELDEYREVVAAFAIETEPPAALRASVLERVQSTPQLPAVSLPPAAPGLEPGPAVTSSGVSALGSGPTPDAGATPGLAAAPGEGTMPDAGNDVVDLASRRRSRRWGVAAVSVAAAAAIAVPTTIAVQVTAERDRLREQSQVVAEMLADPEGSILRRAIEGGGQASVLVADGDLFFRAEDLPDLDPDRAYQLWVVAPDGSVSSAGVLAEDDGDVSSLVRQADGIGIAVTVEPEGGSEQPTTDPIVVLTT
ncbi:anti-sigma factor [Promicromonospora sp. Populi]|uniref:anti-sigma factor domain-containing protein n=1 Tax=Promicromonospora sp. Populi TaxID=3239420 RepID=UPI0034E2E253